jgi:hypothetical protein
VTAWSYFTTRRAWKRSHGGSTVGNVAVAVLGGGLTGSQVAVVAFILLTFVINLARRAGSRQI